VKLIVGLWNPWDKYEKTRHNLGFIFVEKFASENNFSDWKYESKFTADTSIGALDEEKTILVKPQTFMNLSGDSVQKICNFYKINADDIVVIYDDISMDFGKIRSRDSWSAGWHNGVKDIIKHMWEVWKRIKVGVGNNDNYETSDWVLSKFTEEELINIDTAIYEQISEQLKKN